MKISENTIIKNVVKSNIVVVDNAELSITGIVNGSIVNNGATTISGIANLQTFSGNRLIVKAKAIINNVTY